MNQFDLCDSTLFPNCGERCFDHRAYKVGFPQQMPFAISIQRDQNSRIEADTERANQHNNSGYQHFSLRLNTMRPTQRLTHLLDTKGPKF